MKHHIARKGCKHPHRITRQASFGDMISSAIIVAWLCMGHQVLAQVQVPMPMYSNPAQSAIDPIVQDPVAEKAAELQRQADKLAAQRQEDRADSQNELLLDAPILSKMNQSAMTAETAPVTNKSSNGQIEVSGGYSDNLFYSSMNKVGSAFVRYSLPLTLSHSGERTRFSASYIPQFTSYSQATGIYQSHLYQHMFLYDLSARTVASWQLTAARYRDVGQFLPTTLPIGGTGIALPAGTSLNAIEGSTLTASNVATSIALLHRMTSRDRITYTATVSWSELLQASNSATSGVHQLLRSQPTAGDVLFEHSVSTSTSLGLEGSEVYVRGLSNATHLTYTTLMGTIRYLVTPNDRISFGAGPLFPLTNNQSAALSDSGTTYAINGLYTHQTVKATISGGYARVLQLNIDNTFLVANQLSGSFIRPIGNRISISADARYIHTPSSLPSLQQTNFGGSVRLDYHTGSRLNWFANLSRSYSSLPSIGTTPLSISRGEISGGVRLALRNVSSER